MTHRGGADGVAVERGRGAGERGARAGERGPWAGEPGERWSHLWSVPRVESWRLLPSTNGRARALAREGAAPWTVVVAEEQSAGRGRNGSRWHSPPGRGVWMSAVVPVRPGRGALLVPLLAALAVCRALESVASGLAPAVKWPNDVLLDGGKVCGILCEGAGERLLVGVGVNVTPWTDPAPGEPWEGVAWLAEAAGRPVARPAVAGGILDALRELVAPSRAVLDGDLLTELGSRDALLGRTVEVVPGPRGTARGIAPDGALRIERADGTVQAVRSGSVRPVDAD